jgi:hypothetical protein
VQHVTDGRDLEASLTLYPQLDTTDPNVPLQSMKPDW